MTRNKTLEWTWCMSNHYTGTVTIGGCIVSQWTPSEELELPLMCRPMIDPETAAAESNALQAVISRPLPKIGCVIITTFLYADFSLGILLITILAYFQPMILKSISFRNVSESYHAKAKGVHFKFLYTGYQWWLNPMIRRDSRFTAGSVSVVDACRATNGCPMMNGVEDSNAILVSLPVRFVSNLSKWKYFAFSVRFHFLSCV